MLSNEEIDAARALIDEYRRFARNWRLLRWLVFMAGILMLIVMALAWQQLENLARFDAVTLPGEPRASELKAMLLERIDMARLEFKLYMAVFLHAALGPILVMTPLYGWNRWPLRSMLKAKLLETALENELAAGRTFEFMKEEDA